MIKIRALLVKLVVCVHVGHIFGSRWLVSSTLFFLHNASKKIFPTHSFSGSTINWHRFALHRQMDEDGDHLVNYQEPETWSFCRFWCFPIVAACVSSRDFWDLCLNKMQCRKCFNVIFTCSFKTSARHKHIQYVRSLRPLHVRWMAQSWSQEYQSEDAHLSCFRYGKIVNQWTLKILAIVFSLIQRGSITARQVEKNAKGGAHLQIGKEVQLLIIGSLGSFPWGFPTVYTHV